MFRVFPLILLISCATGPHPKAAEMLEAQLKEGISEPYQEIALYALIRAGWGDSAGVRAGVEKMLSEKPTMLFRWALRAMVLSELDPARYRREILTCAYVLVNNQQVGGSWNYYVDAPAAQIEEPVRQTVFPEALGGRNCVAHFAVMGLRACRKAGIRIEDAVFERARQLWVREQNPDGSWGCCGGKVASGAITAAALTIVRSDKGMTWLKNNLQTENNPGRPGVWRYYYFWCLAMLAAETRDPELTAAVEKVRARLRALWPWPNDHHPVADAAFGLLALSD